MPEFYMILARKIIKILEFFMIFARKIYKIPEVYMILARKNARILHNCPKNIFSRILGGTCPLPRLLRLCSTE